MENGFSPTICYAERNYKIIKISYEQGIRVTTQRDICNVSENILKLYNCILKNQLFLSKFSFPTVDKTFLFRSAIPTQSEQSSLPSTIN